MRVWKCKIQIFEMCLVLLFGAIHVQGQEETTCQGQPINMNDHQKAQVTECLDAAGIKSIWKIPAEKLACLGVCIMEKKEMLTPEGKINHQKALAYIDMVMPASVKKALIDGVDKCIKDHGDKVKKDNDPKCMSFMDVGQCVHDVFFDVRKVKGRQLSLWLNFDSAFRSAFNKENQEGSVHQVFSSSYSDFFKSVGIGIGTKAVIPVLTKHSNDDNTIKYQNFYSNFVKLKIKD